MESSAPLGCQTKVQAGEGQRKSHQELHSAGMTP